MGLEAELVVGEEGVHGRRGLVGKVASGMGARGESVGPMVEHALGEPSHGGLDAEVGEDGVGLPSAQELDVVLVDAGNQAGGGAARAKGAATEAVRGDARDVFDMFCCVAQGVRDELGLDCVPAAMVRVVIVVTVERLVWRGVSQAQSQGDATEGFRGAEEGVVVGRVADLLATHGVLLVREVQRGMGDA